MKSTCTTACCAALVMAVAGVAADKAGDLTKTGDTYEHSRSGSRFAVPKGWQALEAQTIGRSSLLGMRKPHPEGEGQPGIEVTLFWSPLGVTFEEAVNLEHSHVETVYGKDKVGKPEPIKLGDKNGFKILVDAGPSRNAKEAGAVYLFEAGTGDNRWKIKLRATVQKMTQAESLKAVEGLLEGLKW